MAKREDTTGIPSLQDFQDWQPAVERFAKVDEHLNRELIFWSVSWEQGRGRNTNTFAVVEVSYAVDSERFMISTGAEQPMQMLKARDRSKQFPFRATFVRKGNMIELR